MKKSLLLVTMLVTIFLGGCAFQVTDDSMTEQDVRNIIKDMLPEDKYDVVYNIEDFEKAVATSIEKANESVIGISNKTTSGTGTGSGVIYKKEGNKYFVVTNHHVIDRSIGVTVVYERDKQLFEISNNVEIIGSDATTDLAVLTFETKEYFPVIEFGDSDAIKKGQFVFAIGNPLGFDYFGTVTMGVVSGLSRYVSIDENSDGKADFETNLMQHDASISPGNSGGALVDINGKLIGVNNMKIVEEDVSNIGFAIPTKTVSRIVADLEENGEVIRPFLGIVASVYNSGSEQGLRISEVVQGGAAQAAGLKANDVIIEFNGEPVRTFLELQSEILDSKVGDTVTITYIRNNSQYTTDATLVAHPDDR